MGDYLAVSVREALLSHPDPEAVLRYSELAPYDTHVVEVCLARLGAERPPRQAAAAWPPGRGRALSTYVVEEA